MSHLLPSSSFATAQLCNRAVEGIPSSADATGSSEDQRFVQQVSTPGSCLSSNVAHSHAHVGDGIKGKTLKRN